MRRYSLSSVQWIANIRIGEHGLNVMLHAVAEHNLAHGNLLGKHGMEGLSAQKRMPRKDELATKTLAQVPLTYAM